MSILGRMRTVARFVLEGMAAPAQMLLEQRSLLRMLVRRELVSRTAGTMLGALWMVVQPALQILGLWFFLAIVLRVRSPGSLPFVDYFLIGIIAWTMISEVLLRNLTVLVEFSPLYQRTIFPLPLLPLLPLLVSGAVYGVVLSLVSGVLGGPGAALQAVAACALLLMWLIPMGYSLAVLGLFVREARQVVPFLLTLLMYLTPILYMPDQLPKAMQDWGAFNPLADVMVLLHAIVQGQHWDIGNLVRPLVLWLILMPLSWGLFKRSMPHMREAL